MGAYCFGLEPKEKPPLDGVHHKTRSMLSNYQSQSLCDWFTIKPCLSTICHSLLSFQTPLSPSFIMCNPSLKRWIWLSSPCWCCWYGHGSLQWPSSIPRVCQISWDNSTQNKGGTLKFFRIAHAERETKICKILGENLYRKYDDAFLDNSSNNESGDEFFRKLEEEE